jgi:hypothetical protein
MLRGGNGGSGLAGNALATVQPAKAANVTPKTNLRIFNDLRDIKQSPCREKNSCAQEE